MMNHVLNHYLKLAHFKPESALHILFSPDSHTLIFKVSPLEAAASSSIAASDCS